MKDFSHDNANTRTDAAPCGRGEELVACLYGEEGVTADFTRHLASCPACAGEVAAFSHVRVEVAALRESVPELKESFASLPYAALSFPDAETIADVRAQEIVAPLPSRSWRQARAALAEFFRVSPRWLQACGAAATLALCALASLAVVRTGIPDSQIVTDRTRDADRPAVSQTVAMTRADLDEYIRREVERRTSEIRREGTPAVQAAAPEVIASAGSAAIPRQVRRRQQAVSIRAGGRQQRSVPTASRTRTPADDLTGEEDLPRLSDLLYGTD